MSVNSLVYETALLNREGIAALACGNGEKAHACFKNALEILGYITQFPDLPVGSTPPNACLLDGIVPVPIPKLETEGFFIYQSALLFQPQSATGAQTFTQVDITLFSAAAIFNMALTYHQRAIQGRGSPAAMLRIAAKMYEQFLRVVHNLPMESEGHDVSALLIIGLNNRSQVYFETKDFDKATEILQEVRQLSIYLALQEASQGGALLVLQGDAFEEIALNVLVISPPATAPCA
jgi:tetratricopeptide (TPR) repeat protein